MSKQKPGNPPLVCAFGEPWEGPHPLCEAAADRACERFAESVARGEFDADGYTPNERKTAEKRQQKDEGSYERSADSHHG